MFLLPAVFAGSSADNLNILHNMLPLSPYVCCSNYQHVVSVLDRLLFNNSLGNILSGRYDQMIALCDAPYTGWKSFLGGVTIVPNRKDVLLSIPVNNFSLPSGWAQYDDLGHDLPFWIEKTGEKRVMLVSQDPLRRGQGPSLITLSSPFGMHSLDYRGNRIMTQVVGSLLQNGISVYLTDFRKLYGEQKGKPVDFSHLNSTFEHILTEEVALFDPCVIVSVGKVAEMALLRMSFPGRKKIHVHHPNARFKDKVNSIVDEIKRNF